MSFVNSILKDSAIYALSSVVMRGVQLLIVPLYFTHLPNGEPGLVDLLIGYVLFSINLFSLGVTVGQAREIGEVGTEHAADFSSTALWFSFASTSLVCGICAFFAKPLGHLLFQENYSFLLLGIALCLVVCNQMQDVVLNHFRWSLRPKVFLILTSVYAIIFVVGSWLCIAIFKLGMTGAVVGLAVASLSVSLVGIAIDPKSFFRMPNGLRLRQMLRFSAPLVPAAIIATASNYMPRFSVSQKLSPDQLDSFMLALKLGGVLAPLFGAFAQSMVPHVYREYKNPETPQHLANLYLKYLCISCLLMAGIVAASPWIVFLLGHGKHPEVSIYVGISTLVILLSQSYVFFMGAWLARKTAYVSAVSIFTAVANIGLTIWAVPQFGLWGGLGAMLITNMGSLIATIIISQRFYFVPFPKMSVGILIVLIAYIATSSIWLPFDVSVNTLLWRILWITALIGVVFVTVIKNRITTKV